MHATLVTRWQTETCLDFKSSFWYSGFWPSRWPIRWANGTRSSLISLARQSISQCYAESCTGWLVSAWYVGTYCCCCGAHQRSSALLKILQHGIAFSQLLRRRCRRVQRTWRTGWARAGSRKSTVTRFSSMHPVRRARKACWFCMAIPDRPGTGPAWSAELYT